MRMSLASALALGAVALVAVACSSTTASAPPDPDAPVRSCDSSLCAAGNTCQELDGDLKCRKSCASNTDPATNCPTNYTCVGANEPTELPAKGCTKVASKDQSDALCAGLSAASGTRLTAYACTDGAVPVHGCTSNDGANFCCNDAAPQLLAAPLCVKSFNPVATPNPAKQWGASCLTTGGTFNNPQCDTDQLFYCYAPAGSSDANAYCTHFDCTSDRECGPGFACERRNDFPDADHPDVGHLVSTPDNFHKTQTVCVKREYGSFCRADVDCPALAGQPSHCAQDDKGRGFCTPECKDNTGCQYDARCFDPGVGTNVCYPRASVIVGDGQLCSPCRSDADCGDDGICILGDYTQERFCAKHSPTPCSAASQCPTPAKAGVGTACLHVIPPTKTSEGFDPGNLLDYCVGFYSFAGSDVYGCYTPGRGN